MIAIHKNVKHKYSTAAIGLLLIIFLLATAHSLTDPNVDQDKKDLRFSYQLRPKEECLRDFNNISKGKMVSDVYTIGYYHKINPNIDKRSLLPDIVEIQSILKSISCIALNIIEDKLSEDEIHDLLKEIIIVRNKIKNEKFIGSVNLFLDNILSTFLCGTVFYLASTAEVENLENIFIVIHDNSHLRNFSIEQVNYIIKNETGYSRNIKEPSLSAYMLNVIRDRHKEEIHKYQEKSRIKEFKSNDIILLNLLYNDANSRKSNNPLVKFDDMEFASDYYVVRKMEMWTKLIFDYKRIMNKKESRKELNNEFENTILKRLGEKDNEDYYNIEIDGPIENILSEIKDQLAYNLKNKGKRILLTIYRKCSIINEDLQNNRY